jgi:hypothetical protein
MSMPNFQLNRHQYRLLKIEELDIPYIVRSWQNQAYQPIIACNNFVAKNSLGFINDHAIVAAKGGFIGLLRINF